MKEIPIFYRIESIIRVQAYYPNRLYDLRSELSKLDKSEYDSE